jgi:hypothetical protein
MCVDGLLCGLPVKAGVEACCEARMERIAMSTEIKIPEPLASVMHFCEVYCVADCCGLNAFDINPQWIREWMDAHDPALLAVARQQMEEIIGQLSDTPGNYYFPLLCEEDSSASWIPLLIEWRTAIEQAPNTPLPPPQPPETPASPFRAEVTEGWVLLGCGVLGAAPIVVVIALIYWLLGRL